jgi:transposase
MPRECTVCAHPDAVLINEAIVVEGKSNRAIASHYGLGREAVRRHKEHIPKLLLKARENLDAYNAASILSKIETLQHETLEQLAGAKDG